MKFILYEGAIQNNAKMHTQMGINIDILLSNLLGTPLDLYLYELHGTQFPQCQPSPACLLWPS